MSPQSPRKLREKIQKAACNINFVIDLLDRNSDESDWSVGMECKTTAEELRTLLSENVIPEEYKVAVVGRFKAGKSAFVNELLERKLAGEDTSPETAAVTTFRHGKDVKATIHFVKEEGWQPLKELYEKDVKDPNAHRIKNWTRFKDKPQSASQGEAEKFNLDELEASFVKPGGHYIEILLETTEDKKQFKKNQNQFRKNIKQYTSGSKPHHCLVESIEITAPSTILEEGILLIDTPGLDDTERFRVDLTEKAVQNVDAILFLTKSGASYGQSEKEFLLSLLRKGTVKQLLFVITQIDHTYEQHRKQARDDDEDPETLAERIAFEKRRLSEEIDETLSALSEDNDSPAMKRYREQLGNIDIVFTSAANHRDWKAEEPVRFPISTDDPGGIDSFNKQLLRLLSTESRLAIISRNIEAGARDLLDSLMRIIDRRLEAMRREPNREGAERKLGNFLKQFGDLGEGFKKTTLADAEDLKDDLKNQSAFAEAKIDLIAAAAGDILRDFEVGDAGKHWRTRRSGYWGYMHNLQSRVANRVFPQVSELLGHQTDFFSNYIDKFQLHLAALSSESALIATKLDIGADVKLEVSEQLDTVVETQLGKIQVLLESEESRIVELLEEFVDEEVEDRISETRRAVGDIWGAGTTASQTQEVRKFYTEVKKILEEALREYLHRRNEAFSTHLHKQARQLPKTALSEANAELARVKKEVTASAEAAIGGRKEAFEKVAAEMRASTKDVFESLDIINEFLLEAESEPLAVGAAAVPSEATDAEKPTNSEVESTTEEENPLQQFDDIRNAAKTHKECLKLKQNQANWPLNRIFNEKYAAGATSLLIIDRYLLKGHQIRNLTEAIHAIAESTQLKSLHIVTGLNHEPTSPGNDDGLTQLAKDLFRDTGITMQWSRDPELHDRFVILNNGFVFKLGRGLDIYQPASRATLTNQKLRRVRACEIDIFGSESLE